MRGGVEAPPTRERSRSFWICGGAEHRRGQRLHPQAEPQRKSNLRLQAERVESRQDTVSALGSGLFSSGADRAAAAPLASSARRGTRKRGPGGGRGRGKSTMSTRNAGTAVFGRRAASDFLTLLLWKVGLPWLLPPN